MPEKNGVKITRVNVTDQVYYALKEKIENGEWLPGDRLPSENEQVQIFGVSRMSVRMAMQKLVAFGLLEVKTGGGYYVKDFEFSHVIEHVSGMMLHNIEYDDFNHFRSIIEVESLKLLEGKPIKPRDLKSMAAHCERMREAAKIQDGNGFARADYDFHRQICAMSGNGMFVYSYELIGPLFLEYLAQHYDPGKLTPEMLAISPTDDYYIDAVIYHEQIVEALRVKDISKAIEIVNNFTHASNI